MSRRFAQLGASKLEGFAFLEGGHGLPLVPGAIAHLECRVRSFHDEGDHAVWVGEVSRVAHRPGAAAPALRRPLPAPRSGAGDAGKPGSDRL